MDRTTLRQTLLQQLKEDKITIHGDLDDKVQLRDGLGLDSIEVVDLVINLQNRFGIEFESEELEQLITVGNLLDLLQVKVRDLRSAA